VSNPNDKAALVPIDIIRGDTFDRSMAIMGNNATTGEMYLLDTTGFTARLHIKDAIDGTKMAEAACTTGITGTGDTAMNLTIHIPANVTATFPHGANWRYDLELKDPSGRPKTIMYGPFLVQGDVTQ